MNVFRPDRRRQATLAGGTSPDAMSMSSQSGSASPPDPGIDISSTDYALRRRELMKMMSDLKSMGWVFVYLTAQLTHATSDSAEALIDLPSVVVIGGQSGLWSPPRATTAVLNLLFQRAKAHSSKPSVGYVGR
jgi:hypothetical protein